MHRVLVLVVSLGILTQFSCNRSGNRETALPVTVNEGKAEAFSDLSIYNLPSKWTTQDNDEINLKDLHGKVLVMVMIYTTCKVACPRLVADMRGIEAQIPSDLKPEVDMVMISIDPETDTPERLKEFARENRMDGGQWLFLRGTEADTREFANVLAVGYKKISPMDFSHSNIISVFNRKGEMIHQKEGLGINNEETVGAILSLARQPDR